MKRRASQMSKAAGGKDPFTIFADELTLLRNDIKQLKLSNLSYAEAKKINDRITDDVATFAEAANKLESSVGLVANIFGARNYPLSVLVFMLC